MKKKQTRRLSNPGSKDSSSPSCSEDEKMKFRTRSSARKKKATSSRDSGTGTSMVDLAYEADDSCRSDASSPKQQAMDEYEFDTIEDVPVVRCTRKRKNGVPSKQTNTKKAKSLKANLNVSTSTPVYEGGKPREDKDRISTPEVTPILADDVDIRNQFKNQDDDLTPTIRRSVRKRSFSFHDPDLSIISTQLSFDSNGDSGIIVSPPLKKSKAMTHSSLILHKKSSVSSKGQNNRHSKVASKKSSTSTVCAQIHKKPRTALSPLKYENTLNSKGRLYPEESKMNTSCFGFDSITTPSPIRTKNNKKVKKVVKASQDPKKDYRSPKSSSDSIFDDSPTFDSSPVQSDSHENINASEGSQSLFSDVLFSEDDLSSMSKVTSKTYKGFKPKLKKSKPQITKLDAWASSFNTELEDIERFDLNIE